MSINKPLLPTVYSNGAETNSHMVDLSKFTHRVTTTNNTPTVIASWDMTKIGVDKTFVIDAVVIGKATVGTHAKKAVSYRVFGGASDLSGTITEIAAENLVAVEQTDLSACTVTVDVSSGILRLLVTGIASHTIVWNARVTLFVV
jgi:hypothetical protein